MSDDDTTTFEITRRRALGALVTVGAGAAAAGAGTFAAFSDTETGTTKQVTASTLDLQVVPGEDATETDDGRSLLELGSLAPGDEGSLVCSLTNAGDTDALLTIKLGALQRDGDGNVTGIDPTSLAEDSDNVNTDPEVEADDDLNSVDDTGDGELAENLNMELRLTETGAGLETGSKDSREGEGDLLIDDGGATADGKGTDIPGEYSDVEGGPSPIPLNGGETRYLVLDFALPNVGNEVQGDAVAFDTLIQLDQDTSQ